MGFDDDYMPDAAEMQMAMQRIECRTYIKNVLTMVREMAKSEQNAGWQAAVGLIDHALIDLGQL